MQAVDPFQYREAIQATFSKLLMVDSYRSGYYHDLSECVMVSSSPPVTHALTVASWHRVVLLARHFLYRCQWRIHIVAHLACATPFRRHVDNSGDHRESDCVVSEDA